MEPKETRTPYRLEELAEFLEKMRSTGDGYLNYPSALYCLTQQILRQNEAIAALLNDVLLLKRASSEEPST
jgi:hypothetical protein